MNKELTLILKSLSYNEDYSSRAIICKTIVSFPEDVGCRYVECKNCYFVRSDSSVNNYKLIMSRIIKTINYYE